MLPSENVKDANVVKERIHLTDCENLYEIWPQCDVCICQNVIEIRLFVTLITIQLSKKSVTALQASYC